MRATKPVPKRQLVFVPVTPTIEVKNQLMPEAHGGHIEVGAGHGQAIFAVPKIQKYEAAENVKGCVG